MQLSLRLETIACLVSHGNRVADVGTDHGYLPIYLTDCGIAPKAIAMDVRRGPLERAKRHIYEAQLENKIETRLSNGLQGLSVGEADTIIIAGMGGPLIIQILSEGEAIALSVKELIVSPHSEIGEVRRFLYNNHYTIEIETMVCEAGKYYTMIKAIPPDRAEHSITKLPTEVEIQYGAYLLENKNEILYEYLKYQYQEYVKIQERLTYTNTENTAARKKELDEKLQIIKEAFHYYEM